MAGTDKHLVDDDNHIADDDPFTQLGRRAGAALRTPVDRTQLDKVVQRGRRVEKTRVAAKLVGGAAVIIGALVAITLVRSPARAPVDTPPPGQTTTTTIDLVPRAGEVWIAHERQGAQGYGIYLIRPDGTGLHTPFADVPGGNQDHPEWSPDGSRLAFIVAANDDTKDLWVSGVDGTDATTLIDCVAPCVWVDEPSWSLSGDRIAFQRMVSIGDEIRSSLEILHVDTGAIDVVLEAPRSVVYLAPQWSPDETRLAVEVLNLPEPTLEAEPVGDAIGVLDLANVSAGIQMITDPALFGNEPDWNRDGDLLVYAEQPLADSPQTQLFTISPDGSQRTQITSYAGGSAIQPAFFPDGSRIIYSYSNPPQLESMNTITVDGTDRQVATPTDFVGTHARLRPT